MDSHPYHRRMLIAYTALDLVSMWIEPALIARKPFYYPFEMRILSRCGVHIG